MTTLTMIWNDCHCSGISDHHWHTMETPKSLEELHELGEWAMCQRMMYDYYAQEAEEFSETLEDALEMAEQALRDVGLVGIFIGKLETV